MNVLILGTGQAQLDAIKYLKARGCNVHGCSYIHGDCGESYCDGFLLADLDDINQIKPYVQYNNIGLVYSVGSDLAIPSAMYISEELGLPHYISSKTANLCHDKAAFRTYLGNRFSGNLEFHTIHQREELTIFDNYPYMLKPVDSQGQRGCYKVSNIQELSEKYERSLSFSKKKEVILEQYIEGDEVSLNGYVRKGFLVFSIISDRYSYSEFPGGIIKKHILPSKYTGSEVEDKILHLTASIIERLEIKNGPVYLQMKICDGNPYIIETAPRLDGCHMWRLIKDYCGVDLLEMTLDPLLEGEMLSDDLILEFLSQPPETRFHKQSFQPSKSKYLQWYYNENDTVKNTNGYMEKCGYLIKEEKA